MKYKIPNYFTNFIGTLGEIFLENILEKEKIDFINLNQSRYCFGNEIVSQLKNGKLYLKEEMKFTDIKTKKMCKKIYTWLPYGIPDFLIKDKNIFIECKVNNSGLNERQTKAFPKLLKKGFKIFIAKLKIDINHKDIKLSNIKWYEYTLEKKSYSFGKKISLNYIKKIVSSV